MNNTMMTKIINFKLAKKQLESEKLRAYYQIDDYPRVSFIWWVKEIFSIYFLSTLAVFIIGIIVAIQVSKTL